MSDVPFDQDNPEILHGKHIDVEAAAQRAKYLAGLVETEELTNEVPQELIEKGRDYMEAAFPEQDRASTLKSSLRLAETAQIAINNQGAADPKLFTPMRFEEDADYGIAA